MSQRQNWRAIGVFIFIFTYKRILVLKTVCMTGQKLQNIRNLKVKGLDCNLPKNLFEDSLQRCNFINKFEYQRDMFN